MKRTFFYLNIYLIPVLFLSSCATIMHGSRQNVGVSSNPTNANVWVDQQYMGVTPIILKLTRKHSHCLHVELDGYQPYEAIFTNEVSAWIFGNLIFGGVIGIAVDVYSGGVYHLTPEQVQAEMRTENIAYSKKGDSSYIAIVLKPKPEWQKIDQLVTIQN